jgi:chitinase
LVHGLSGGATTTKASATTTKASSTTSTKTTTTITTTATATPGTCPVNNGACTTNGAYACAGTSFAVCSNKAWVLQSCPSGTTCFSTTDGTSIYCGQGTGGTCAAAAVAAQALSEPLAKPVGAGAGPTAKPFNGAHVTAQIAVSKANTSNFVAVINARRLDATTFGKTVTVQFKVATNIKVNAVENGTIVQKGSNVKISVNNADTETKAIVISFSGNVNSGIFVTPDVATISIN